MNTENNRVRFAATAKGGLECECNESFYAKALGWAVAACAALYGSKKLIDVGIKKWIVG